MLTLLESASNTVALSQAMEIRSPRLLLRTLQADDCYAIYVDWLNDPVVNRFLETRFLPQSLETLKSY